jgi:hypothetical protein
MSPAKISIGSTATEGMTYVRHYYMNDGTTCGNGHGSTASGYKDNMYPAANELQAIKFTREAEDKKDIVIMSFPSHATTVNGTNPTSLSACWPGATRAYVEANSEYLCAVFQGASGDQVPGSRVAGVARVDPQNHKIYGQVMGDYLLGLEFTDVAQSEVVMKSWVFTAKSMKEGIDDAERMAAATEIVSVSHQYGSSSQQVKEVMGKYPGMFPSYYEASGLIDRSKAPETRSMTLNVLQLGSEVSMVFAPYEMFGASAMEIKKLSPYPMTFIVSCSQNHDGYLPSRLGWKLRCYEAQITRYAPGTAEELAKEYVDLLTELKTKA